MKRILLFILLLAFSYPCIGQSRIIPQDKLLHMGGCYVIGATTSSLVYNITEDRKKAFVYGFLTSIVIGGAKEIYDIKHGDPDWGDYACDAVGGALGSFTVVIRF